MKTITTKKYSTPIQLKLPMDLERIIRITDPVYMFNEIMEHIDLHRYFAVKERKTGRRSYDREKLLKIVLFAFMEFGYCSVRQIEKLCVTDIRFLWILDGDKAPSFMTIHNFIHNELQDRVEEIVSDINQSILRDADTNHVYIDGTKLKANAGNSYCKTDHDATFMRVKRDHMGNDQLLPAYNVQMAVCDEYIAHYGVYPFASDMDCFQPLMEGFRKRYGFYPQYPVADAGYGSFNNYLYCAEKGMEKYMKFTMYEKESKDKKYRSNPYRACNFPIDEDGFMVCPNGERFHFQRTAPVKGNQYGRTEEYYQCENCEGCSHREQCHKSSGNRVVQVNEELTSFHLAGTDLLWF